MFDAADAIKAALRGSLDECSEEEDVGFMLIADAIFCLQHLREAHSERKK